MIRNNKTLIIIAILIFIGSFILEGLFPIIRSNKTIEYIVLVIVYSIIGLNFKNETE